MAKDPIRVLVTGATGEYGYALVPMIAGGKMLGLDQPVILHLHDILANETSLDGMKWELEDAKFPLIKSVVVATDVNEAWTDVGIAILLPEIPKRKGMGEEDLMRRIVSVYRTHAVALKQVAAPNCKVLVVADPANTIACILNEAGPSNSSFPAKNITSLSRLEHNRTIVQISQKLNVSASDVHNVVIWGTHHPDVAHVTVKKSDEENSGISLTGEQGAPPELLSAKEEIITAVKQRDDAIVNARNGHPTALSTAVAACDHIRDWLLGTDHSDEWVSMGVYSDGSSYNVPAGLFFSFPVYFQNKEWYIRGDLTIDESLRKHLDAAVKELTEEQTLAYSFLD